MAEASDILSQAKDEFKIDKEAWEEIYRKAAEDLYFLSDEPFAQWDEKEANNRVKIGRPALQIDQLSQFIHQVENDIRMNTPTINVIPDGSGSDMETAEIFKGLIKNIEYKSKADAAYDTAASNAIRGSIGFIRVDHDYVNNSSFEQELLIKRVVNPLSVYIDSNSTEPDGSDARRGFVLEQISRKEFEKKWPKATAISFGDENPNKDPQESDKITIAEYFKLADESEEMGLLEDGTSETYTEGKAYKSTRKIKKTKVLRYKLSGEDVLEKTTFPGRYIPIVPVYGEEVWIEGRRNLYSLIRKSKESQQMYNLWASLETELLLKQQQAPVMAAVGQMRGFETDWKTPDKAMVLYYHQTDASEQPAPQPQRLQPPQIPTGIVNARRETVDDIKSTLGMYSASIGQRSNETSGVAIDARKKEGDVATFHFADNTVRGVTQVGKIIVCAAGEVYDTARLVMIMNEEDLSETVGINGKMADEQKRHYDLTKGEYEVRVTTGASFTTQRQEAAAMYSQLIQAMPDLMPVIGDLVFKYQDSPGSQAISNRLRKLVDPKLLTPEEQEEDQPDPQVQQLQQQLQQVIQGATQQIQGLQAELQSKQGDMLLKSKELEIKQGDQKIKLVEMQAKSQLEEQKLQIDQQKVQIDAQKVGIDAYNAQKEVVPPQTQESQPIKLDTTGFNYSKTPEALALEQQEMDNKNMQAQAVIQVLSGIQQQLAALTEQTAHQVNQTATLTQQVSQPITVIRDDMGNITGAV